MGLLYQRILLYIPPNSFSTKWGIFIKLIWTFPESKNGIQIDIDFPYDL
jgi:hypothetical protein